MSTDHNIGGGGLALTIQLTEEQLDAIAQRVAAINNQPKMSDDIGYLDAAGAAEYLATTKERIYDLVQLRKLRPRRDGRRLLFTRDDLESYLQNG